MRGSMRASARTRLTCTFGTRLSVVQECPVAATVVHLAQERRQDSIGAFLAAVHQALRVTVQVRIRRRSFRFRVPVGRTWNEDRLTPPGST